MNWQALRSLAQQGYAPRALLDVGAHLGAFSNSFVEIFPGCAPVLIEPNPHCAESLSKLPYECHAFAASNDAGEAELHLTSEWLQSTGASLYRENTHFFRDDVLQKVVVPRRRLDDALTGRRFDVVKIDVQGAEVDVLRGGKAVIGQADFVLIEVSLVDYNAGGAKAEDVFAELAAMGFSCAEVLEFHRLRGVANGALLQLDFLFENRARKDRIRPGGDTMAELASALLAAGLDGAADTLLQHAAGLSAPDPMAIEVLAKRRLADGELASALDLLVRLRAIAPQSPGAIPILQLAIPPAVERINKHLSALEWERAAAIAGPLATLLPGFVPAQRAAMIAFANLSDAENAGVCARRILALEGADRTASRIERFSQIVAQAKPAEAESARQGLFPPFGRHALLTLRDLHDATAAILCGELRDADLSRLNLYGDEAQKLVVEVPDTADLEGWVKHYRLAMDAMRPSRILEPAPAAPSIAPPALTSATGVPMTEIDFARLVAIQNPSAVFFVAADARYVGLYANHYIDSIVGKCDVPFMIVLHVIGGAGRLSGVAASLCRQDSNIVLTGDTFDAAAVVTKCFDTPPKGLIVHPAAHYQSARFQWLGWLLGAVNKPVFVSDIDLLLQRGVADLLAREAGSDIVLNENDSNMNGGSRLTANLLLLNPLPGAQFFANALRSYLDDTLCQPEVSRWIDQYGLLMARHRLRRERPEAKIGYFDTQSDINNVMYRTYETNPFRFLSLYHGFDMESLKSAA